MNRITTKAAYLIRTRSIFLEPRVGFKSIYSIDKLYPNSSYDFSSNLEKQTKEVAEKAETFHGFIPMDQLTIKKTRSSGPGGQNVNKVNTKVEVRFKIDSATFIPTHLKALMMDKCKTRITKDGFFYIDSEKTRSQAYNLADCLDKIRFIIRGLEQSNIVEMKEDPEEVARRIRRAAAERLREKREHSLKKEGRRMDDFI